MKSSIEFFLKYQLQPSKYHSKGWEWYVLDREGTNQDILNLLFTESAAFSKSLIGHEGRCIRQPQGGCFDLVVQSPRGKETFVEIKFDAGWNEKQREKQIALLRSNGNRKAVLIILSQAACRITKDKVTSLSKGLFSMVSYRKLYKALDAAKAAAKQRDISEIAAAYKAALQEQEIRANKAYM
jgi:hypothetical protein